ncbi:hypothetical protein UPYG_G00109640 [Umbra pygmaea]|uniref:E3 ubiquitin-protein ligase TRIM39-like n=1 Tax=Umbra pygmaea TaxID=75934 RepID=A0ABD0X2M2_UMBPY
MELNSMASFNPPMSPTFPITLLPEKHLLCPLCKDIFNNPVTTPCGHSFCHTCLSSYWTRHSSDYCPQCRRMFPARPDLNVNRILADVCNNYRMKRPEESQDMVVDIDQMIQERLQIMDRLRNSLENLKKSSLREVRESQKMFSTLVNSIENSHKVVVAAIEERRLEAEKRIENKVKLLEQEIQELRNVNPELGSALSPRSLDDGKKNATLGPTSSNVSSDRKECSQVTMETDLCMGLTRKALSELVDMVKTELNRISKMELKKIQKYAVDISLSPKTANAFLSVSEDRKQVRYSDKRQDVPDNPKRFERMSNVMCREAFSSGRYYWEVEVGEKIEWTMGVARQSVNRKGRFTFSPVNGFWTLSLTEGQYVANTSPNVTPVFLEQKPRKVGVFLEYAEGRVSFNCAENGLHIFTFTDSFTDRLHPIFSPGLPYGGRNAAPLVISTIIVSS